MRRFRKAFAMLLSAMMLAGSLSGCGADSSGAALGSGTTESTEGVERSFGGDEDDTGDHTGYVATLTPATDFYGYINGENLLEMSLDEKHKEVGSLRSVGELVDGQMDDIIDDIISKDGYEQGSYEQIIHDMYYLFVNTEDGIVDTSEEDCATVETIIDKINAPTNTDELLEAWHDLSLEYGFSAPLGVSLEMDFMNNERYIFVISFNAPADLEAIKTSDGGAVISRDSLADQLKILGVPSEEASERATDVIYALREVASFTDLEIVNGEKQIYDYYDVYPSSDLESKLSNLSVDKIIYSAGMEVETPEELAVTDPGQWSTIDGLFDNEHLQVWKDMTSCLFLSSYADYLPDKYGGADDTDLSADKKARNFIKNQMSSVIGEIYAERYYTEEKRETITRICDDLKAEYYNLIEGAEDISDEGKAYLTGKLDNMKFFIGADEPHEIDPSDGDFFDESLLQTMINFMCKLTEESMDKYGEVPEKNGFTEMSPSTVNACYCGYFNCINITAAITNEPLYDENADYYTNLGRIGSIIGHEISHAFDSKGVLWDENGNLDREAFPEVDREAFEKLQEQAIEYYNTFTVLGSHVNGELTLAENLADISGVQACLAIAGTKENQQKVLESYAVTWCSLIADTTAKQLLEIDDHSPDIVRINAVVSCFDEFYEIYDVKEGDPMYVAPEERVRRW